jgi:hypothetical protein
MREEVFKGFPVPEGGGRRSAAASHDNGDEIDADEIFLEYYNSIWWKWWLAAKLEGEKGR